MIRRVEPRDVDAVVGLVHELALYERAPEQCHLTAEQLHTALFSEHAALFGHVAEVDGQVVGMALWFLNFSTWDGVHGIYLEDLYVTPEQRGKGFGKQLLEVLARECIDRGYTRLQWWVLNWNEPSIGFYKSLGAIPMDEWTVMRVADEALRELGSAR
ncbi:GNAT family N-acetyltransferase [Nocardia sp. NRRL S-836]|uniref:GNAT family N-acetyltransferase n=1 Tax=Nocardia sp. NRRL S-836 TaxID=1519492 RepID=UPI0006AE4DD7|nr:GNAT family N-acetyltransferase [Nocardia sp. NRRL S-836]KOV81972.1 GCN5 family acetyltransferase [Nocardia sp. NRRL S-836]